MKRTILVCTAAVVFAGSAWAQDKAAKPAAPATAPATAPAQGTGAQAAAPQGSAANMDMSKMGPAARKPTNEKQTKKEIMDFFKKMEEAGKSGDMEAMNAMIDFPIFMATDNMQGMPETKQYSREEYTAMMKPMMENMPKDIKTTHKPTISVLSDSLATVTDDFTMTIGKQKITGRNAGLLVKRDGQWKWKSMIEAGWGDAPGAGGSGQPAPTEGKK